MKKALALIFALVMLVAVFAACGESSEKADNTEYKVVINNGIRDITAKYKKGDVIEAPADPARNGFIFEGWFIGEEKIEFPYTVKGEVTIAAKLTPEPAEPVTLAYQPIDIDVARGEKQGPWVEPIEVRGYVYTYQWYVNTTDSNEGGTAIPNATDSTCMVPTLDYKEGDKVYVYCEVTGTRNSNGASASTKSEAAEVTITAGGSNILFVGAAQFVWTAIKNDSINYLDAMLKAGGYEYGIDKIVREGSTYNIWEEGLTGINQEAVKNMMEMKYYDYVILQLGRDYILTTPTTREKEIQSVRNIVNYVQKFNPQCKVILYQPAPRVNMESTYWQRYRDEGGFQTIDDVKTAIRSYVNEHVLPVAPNALVADLTTGFDKLTAEGINPYGTGSQGQDFPNAEGGYLGSCIMYSLITGKTSEGIAVYSTPYSSVDPATAAKIQKIATELAVK